MDWLWNHPFQLTQHMPQSPMKAVRHAFLSNSRTLRAVRFVGVRLPPWPAWLLLREVLPGNTGHPMQLGVGVLACRRASSSRVSDSLRKAVSS